MTGTWWDRITSDFAQASPPAVTVFELVVILTVAIGLSVPGVTWRYFRPVHHRGPTSSGATIPAAISAGAFILPATILFIRNGTGLLIILACEAISWTLVMFLPRELSGHVTIAVGLALLVGSVRDLVNVISVHLVRRSELPTSDAYLLFRRTMIPSPVWLLLFSATIGWPQPCGRGSATRWCDGTTLPAST